MMYGIKDENNSFMGFDMMNTRFLPVRVEHDKTISGYR